mmetsp:Transcript_29357/g.76952  ORF Transcript_29357/g.76952 Transcript_29357/m.76952 type:complete len:467 (+) Transcript_29357:37-1437(+)
MLRVHTITRSVAVLALLACSPFAAADTSGRRLRRATQDAVGCTQVNLRVVCESLGLTEAPELTDSSSTKLEARGNQIHDGVGVLTAAQLTNLEGHPSLIELQLQANGIVSVAVGTFDQHGQLEVLRLFGNAIVTLQSDAFRGLVALQKLYLNSNPLVAIPAGLFRPFVSTIEELYLHACPQLAEVADGSINAITNRPITLQMTNTASQCTLSPFDTFDCLCAPDHSGGTQGFCAPDSPPTDAPVTAAPVTNAPVTDAPVTNAPVTAAPVTASPVPDSADRDGIDETAKGGKKGKKGGDDEAPAAKEGTDVSGKGGKKSKGDDEPAAKVADGTSGKAKKGDDEDPQGRVTSGSGEDPQAREGGDEPEAKTTGSKKDKGNKSGKMVTGGLESSAEFSPAAAMIFGGCAVIAVGGYMVMQRRKRLAGYTMTFRDDMTEDMRVFADEESEATSLLPMSGHVYATATPDIE